MIFQVKGLVLASIHRYAVIQFQSLHLKIWLKQKVCIVVNNVVPIIRNGPVNVQNVGNGTACLK
jgi:hypothetical protein